MFRHTLLAALCLLPALPALASADTGGKGKKVAYAVHDGQFEKNNSGLKGDASYLLIADRAAFDKIFGSAFTMGKKPNVVPKDAFEKKLVAAVVKRGNAVWKYEVESVTAEGGSLYVRYRATEGKAGTATFASPLIITVDKGAVKKAVFIENGKEVGTAEAK